MLILRRWKIIVIKRDDIWSVAPLLLSLDRWDDTGSFCTYILEDVDEEMAILFGPAGEQSDPFHAAHRIT